MLKLAKKPEYSWPIELHYPVDGGKTATDRFVAIFRRVTQEEIEGLRARAERSPLVDGEPVKDADLVREVLIGWRGVQDADGNEVPFSDESMCELLDQYPGAGFTIMKAFYDSLAGGAAKNLRRSPTGS